MPWYLPAELSHFKEVTMSKPIIMGRKTFESIGRSLPGRQNIVITRDRSWKFEGVDVVHSIEAAIKVVDGAEEVMIIGGAKLYRQMLGCAQRLYLTLIDIDIEGDTHFPEFNWDEWQEVENTHHPADHKNAYAMNFIVLDKKRLVSS